MKERSMTGVFCSVTSFDYLGDPRFWSMLKITWADAIHYAQDVVRRQVDDFGAQHITITLQAQWKESDFEKDVTNQSGDMDRPQDQKATAKAVRKSDFEEERNEEQPAEDQANATAEAASGPGQLGPLASRRELRRAINELTRRVRYLEQRLEPEDRAKAAVNWLRRNANAEANPEKKAAFIEAHNAVLSIIQPKEEIWKVPTP